MECGTNRFITNPQSKIMSEPNYAGNIIVNLASLPDFLRKPIMSKRLREFFTLPEDQQQEIVQNALEAGPDIPFPNFARLCKTWLESVALLEERHRLYLFEMYMRHISRRPHELVRFNLDGMLEVLMALEPSEQQTIKNAICHSMDALDDKQQRLMQVLIPSNAKKVIGM